MKNTMRVKSLKKRYIGTIGNLRFYIIQSPDLNSLKKPWQKLEKNTKMGIITNSWEWNALWIASYGDKIPHWVLMAEHDGELRGITLLTRQTGRQLPVPIKAYHVGTAGEPFKEWVNMIGNQLLVHPIDLQSFIQGIIVAIGTIDSWEEIVFDGYLPNAIPDIENVVKTSKLKSVLTKEACRIVDLAKLRKENKPVSSVFSQDMRYAIKRTKRAFNDDIVCEWADDVRKGTHMMNSLIELHQKRWENSGKRGMFASERFTTFHKNAIKTFLRKDKAGIFLVRSTTYGILGCLYFFIDNGICYGYQSGIRSFNEFTIPNVNSRRLKIAQLVHSLCMEECMKRNIRIYNFSTGNSGYKMDLSNDETDMVWFSIRKTIKPYLRDWILTTYFSLDKKAWFRKIMEPLYKLT